MKRKRLFSWLQQTKADVLFLQETHSTPDSEHEWKKRLGAGYSILTWKQRSQECMYTTL